eukprot:SRR837773.402.p1 GENE.SRR837773.402~~SRR837773.402.p1  ORF type:complete len:318 (-),score=114.68 SRR837773.402:8-961(-)
MKLAKDQGLQAVVLGFEPPTFTAFFDERPFCFSVDWDEAAKAFLVSFSRGIAVDKGIAAGCALLAIGEQQLAGMDKADVQALLKQTELPVRMLFRAAVHCESVDRDSGPKLALEGQAEPAAKRARTEAPEARSTKEGLVALDRLASLRVSLSKPLGIFFDKECGVEKIGPGSQAAELGVLAGMQVRAAGGRPLARQATECLVKRIKRAKAKGLAELTLGVALPKKVVQCTSRPFGFAAALDAARGVFLVTEASAPLAEQGVAAGLALASIGGVEVVGLTDSDLAKVLDGSELPVDFVFRPIPSDEAPVAPELSEGED